MPLCDGLPQNGAAETTEPAGGERDGLLATCSEPDYSRHQPQTFLRADDGETPQRRVQLLGLGGKGKVLQSDATFRNVLVFVIKEVLSVCRNANDVEVSWERFESRC